jgi:NTE family protein
MMLAKLRRLYWRLRPPVLALGGGGARGFAHLGVLQVIDEHRLPVRAIVGTSMGAVIGAMYLVHGSAAKVIERWRGALDRDLIPSVRPMRTSPIAGVRESPLIQMARKIRNRVVVSFAMNRRTMLGDEALKEALDFLVPDCELETVEPPFVAVATDLQTGEEVRLSSGGLHQALRASGAIPGLLPAVSIGGRQLVDGGVVAEVPVHAAAAVGGRVVAVDVSMELPPLHDDRLVLDTMMRTQMMTARLLREHQLATFSAVIRPQVGAATWAEWARFDELVHAGRDAAYEWLGEPKHVAPYDLGEPEVQARDAGKSDVAGKPGASEEQHT